MEAIHLEWLQSIAVQCRVVSVIGSISFLVHSIYVNDLLDGIHSSGELYADGSKVYRRLRDDKLQEWKLKWLQQFNEEKCKVMHIGKHKLGKPSNQQ